MKVVNYIKFFWNSRTWDFQVGESFRTVVAANRCDIQEFECPPLTEKITAIVHNENSVIILANDKKYVTFLNCNIISTECVE